MTYKKFLTLLPITLLTLSSFGQPKFKIISREDGSFLPYATIINYTKKIFLSADITGQAVIDVSPGDSLIISYVGYKDDGFIFNAGHKTLITLDRLTKFLPDAFVFNCKKKEKFVLKNPIKPRKQRDLMSGISWSYSDLTKTYALLINDIPQNSLITKFSFWLRKMYGGAPDSMIEAPIIIMVYGVDPATQLPGRPLLSKPIIFNPKKQGKQSLNLDSVQLIAPSNGFYIAIQDIMDKKYAWENTNVKTATGKDTSLMLYGGIIESGLNTGNFKPVTYDQPKQEWITFSRNVAISFDIEFKQCAN